MVISNLAHLHLGNPANAIITDQDRAMQNAQDRASVS